MRKFALSPIGASVMLLVAATSTTAFAQKQDEVVVTGSAIKRIVSDEALPIQIITKDEIRSFGVSNTEELMKFMPIAQSMGGLNSSLDGAGGVTNYGQATISLRGLGDAYTLVLVNGRPADGNLNLIPLAAIERIEILQDGASSVYGSNAVAGVVNFIMSSNVQGVEASLTTGRPTRAGGGQRTNFGLTFGKGKYSEDGFNITGSISVETEKELYAGDRDFAKTGNVFPYLVGSATGQGNIQGAWNPGVGKINPFGSTLYGNPLADSGKCESIGMFLYPGLTSKGAPYCMYDSAKDVRLVPEREAKNLTLSGKFKLNNNVQLFGDMILSQTDLTSRYQPNPVRESFLVTDSQFAKLGVDTALLISPSNPNYKIASDYLTKMGFTSLVGQTLAVTSRVFDFGPRTNTNNLTNSRVVAGARGDIGEHSWEVAAYNIDSKTSSGVTDGYFSQVKFAQIINSRNDWNPWAPASAQTDAFKQAVQAARFAQEIMKISQVTRGADAKVTGPAFSAPGGQSMYAAGVQYQTYGLTRSPSEALATGDIAGLGGAQLALDKSRSLTAGFGELQIPMAKNWELNGSVRRDQYSDFGTADTYKASTRWTVSPQAIIRASLGTGFRAPSLTQLWTPQTTGTSATFTDPKFPGTPQQVLEVSGGNPNLKPEKSKQNSIGIILTPVKDLTVSLDLWNINISDKINTPSTQEIVSRYRSGDSAYNNLVTVDPATGQVVQTKSVLANIGSASYSGVDVNAAYKMKLEQGNMNFSLYGTYMNKADETSSSGTVSKRVGTMVDANGDPVIGADSGGVIVRWKHLLSASYETGAWRYTLSQNFYTGYRTGDQQGGDYLPNYVPNQATYNAQIAYSGVKNLRMTLGVKNLFDKNPPLYIPVSNQFAAGYDISMYDPRARFVYLSANYKFN